MITKTRIVLTALLALPALFTARADESPAPTPAKEMHQLGSFEGDWTCLGNVPESPLGPARKTSTSASFHKALDGMWISGQLKEPVTKENPHAYQGMAHMTYDAAAKSYLLLWVDNFGGWAHQTSPGWDGDRMVWLGDGSMSGSKVTARDTFTKKGAEMHHLGELQMDGKWVTVQNELCKQNGAKK